MFLHLVADDFKEMSEEIDDLKRKIAHKDEIIDGLESQPRKNPQENSADPQIVKEILKEKAFKKPVVIYNYPEEIKPFYMKLNEDKETVLAMDVLLPKLGEIIGGSQREDDLDKLMARMKEKGMDPEEYWWYLDLRRYGTAPHSGFGLGFERLVQFVTGMENIRDVIPFPRTPKHAGF